MKTNTSKWIDIAKNIGLTNHEREMMKNAFSLSEKK